MINYEYLYKLIIDDILLKVSYFFTIYLIFYFLKMMLDYIFLFKNNRKGLSNGHSNKYGDRMLEIFNKKKVKYGTSNLVRNSVVISGNSASEKYTNIAEIDDILIERNLIVKKTGEVSLNTNFLELRFLTNFVLQLMLNFTSRYIYLDNKNYFK